jgi:polysaccharide pyruvyl transferase WcaK-like protein
LLANLAKRVLDERRREALSRRLLGGRTHLPFLLSPADFRADVRTAYNTIGCGGVARLSGGQLAPVAAALERASFLSVRERASRDAVAKITAARRTPELAPDSAMLMCRMTDPERLLAQVGEPTRHWIERHRRRYVCLQISRHWLGPHAAVLAGQLDRLQRQHGLEVLLLPIGRAHGHEDVAALAEVRRHMPRPAALFDDLSIWEIMALIAWSGLFAGTSLHGAVTAQAFAVPRVGLVPRHVKLAEYLQPWDIPEQQECVAPSQLAIAAERVMGVPAARREARREELVTAYEQTFERMAEALGFERSLDLRSEQRFGDGARHRAPGFARTGRSPIRFVHAVERQRGPALQATSNKPASWSAQLHIQALRRTRRPSRPRISLAMNPSVAGAIRTCRATVRHGTSRGLSSIHTNSVANCRERSPRRVRAVSVCAASSFM